MIAPSYEEKLNAVRKIIDSMINDLKNGTNKQSAGWRTVEDLEITDNVLAALRKERIIFESGSNFRLNLMNDRITQRYRELRLKIEQRKYFYQNYEHNQQKINNQRRIIQELEQFARLFIEQVFSIDEYASIGFWKLLSRIGISAPIDDIIRQGYSPRNWAVISFSAIPQLTEDLFYNEHSGGKIIQSFEKANKLNLLPKTPTINYLDNEEIERIKQISQWDVLKENLTNEAKLYLGCLWFTFYVIDEKSYTAYFEERSDDVNNALSELFISLFDRNLTQVIDQLEREFTQLESLRHWFSEVVILPEGV